MASIDVYNRDGDKVHEIELPLEQLDDVTVTVSNVVRAHMANQRRGTHSTKTRGMTRGGGRKPWRQKGTGRARAGTRRSPLWTGGGIVFGPHPRDYSQKIPQKVRRKALLEALGYKLSSIRVLDELKLNEPKTREIFSILKNNEAQAKPLLVTTESDKGLWLASRNIPGSSLTRVEDLNAYLVMWHHNLVFTQAAAEKLGQILEG